MAMFGKALGNGYAITVLLAKILLCNLLNLRLSAVHFGQNVLAPLLH